MKRYKKLFESVLDPSKKELNPSIFENNIMKKEVSQYIIDVLADWKQNNAPEMNIDSLILIGSSAGFNYNNQSDIDINVKISNIDNDLFETIIRILPNGNLLPDTEHPINYFLVFDNKAVLQADNAYDILHNQWIKEPIRNENEINYSYILEISKFFIAGIDNRISELETDLKQLKYYESLKQSEEEVNQDDINQRIILKNEEIIADLDSLQIANYILHSFRQEAFDQNNNISYSINIQSSSPNKSINNIIYKIIESLGYFNKLKKYEKLREKFNNETI